MTSRRHFRTEQAREGARAAIKAHNAEWSGSCCPRDPDNCWIDDATGEHVNATTGERTRQHPLDANAQALITAAQQAPHPYAVRIHQGRGQLVRIEREPGATTCTEHPETEYLTGAALLAVMDARGIKPATYWQRVIRPHAQGYDPRHIEGYIRLAHDALGNLSARQLRAEIALGIDCIKEDGIANAERNAQSFGL